ncbi:hypothetical protein [Microvirga roseola]|uniref:hypothetical protein n=1 Tax=Microvirga roseola TaxID=2883126 RepID=UPI001E414ECD|nr:hypothetical protein [Microvirga roseola]
MAAPAQASAQRAATAILAAAAAPATPSAIAFIAATAATAAPIAVATAFGLAAIAPSTAAASAATVPALAAPIPFAAFSSAITSSGEDRLGGNESEDDEGNERCPKHGSSRGCETGAAAASARSLGSGLDSSGERKTKRTSLVAGWRIPVREVLSRSWFGAS